MNINRPNLDTLDERREYLMTQFDHIYSDSISRDSFCVPESRLYSFLIRVKETYGLDLFFIELTFYETESGHAWHVDVKYSKKKNKQS